MKMKRISDAIHPPVEVRNDEIIVNVSMSFVWDSRQNLMTKKVFFLPENVQKWPREFARCM